MADSKKEIFEDDLDVVVGGSVGEPVGSTGGGSWDIPSAPVTNNNNTMNGDHNKTLMQGQTNSINNSQVHMGNTVNQTNNVSGNAGNVNIDKPLLISDAGRGNVYHL